MSDETTDMSAGWLAMKEILGRVAVGPKGSRDLSEEQAYNALKLCLEREPSDIQIGVFLIALRLKRETLDENRGFLRALRESSTMLQSPAPRVLALCDPYDGFSRVPHFAPVVAAVLGACGLPTYVHGAWTMPPKDGITARQVLQAFGVRMGHGYGQDSLNRAAARLASTGAAYVAVEDFCPPLAGMTSIRKEIAKRPFLATLEKLIVPIRGSEETHVCSGWVHKGYDDVMMQLLQESDFTSTFLLKGREGHVDPFLHTDTETFAAKGKDPAVREWLRPKSYGLVISNDGDWDDLSAEGIAELWDQALTRKHREVPGQTVRLLAGTMLAHCGVASTIMRGVGLAHNAIVSGQARQTLLQMGL
jgi:anthranilate phosphoribosyltransferase